MREVIVRATGKFTVKKTNVIVSRWNAFLRKVDVRLPEKENSNSHGATSVHQIISMIKWIRTSKLSIKNSLSDKREDGRERET